MSQNGVFKGFDDFSQWQTTQCKPLLDFYPVLSIDHYIKMKGWYVYESPEIYKKIT